MRLVLLLFLAALLASGAIVAALLWKQDAPGRIVEAEIAGMRFFYAPAYARDNATATGGMTDRLNFVAQFPDFAPLAPRERAGARTVAIAVTLKDDAMEPAERPAHLYARFLGGEAWNGPGGLILRRFEANTPYDLEELYLAPPDGRSFFARCPKPQGGAPTEGCLSIFRVGAVDVELRYAPALLEHWEALLEGARMLLARIIAAPVPSPTGKSK